MRAFAGPALVADPAIPAGRDRPPRDESSTIGLQRLNAKASTLRHESHCRRRHGRESVQLKPDTTLPCVTFLRHAPFLSFSPACVMPGFSQTDVL
jgi:hypothetical protein